MTPIRSTNWFTRAVELGERRRAALAALNAVVKAIDALLDDDALTPTERQRFTLARRRWIKLLERATAT